MSEYYTSVDMTHIDKALGLAAQKKVTEAQNRVAQQVRKDAIEKQAVIQRDAQRKAAGDRITRNPQGPPK